jgi:nicotinamidase-related amidase
MSIVPARRTSDALLLVVGMQNDKCSRLHAQLPHLVPRINACIREASARGWKLVFALDLHHPQHVSFQKASPHCVLQTYGAQMVRALEYLQVRDADMVVRGLDKDGDSDDAFYVSAGSPSRLKDLLWNPVAGQCLRFYMCGVSPDGSIEVSAQTASERGCPPVVIADASYMPLALPLHATLQTLDALLTLLALQLTAQTE